MNRKQMVRIFLLVSCCAVFIWALNNLNMVYSAFSQILNVTSPLILGGVIAFIVNLPMKQIEFLFDKIFSKFNKTIPLKIKRPIALLLATVFIIGIFLALTFIIVPRFARTISSFIVLLPDYLKTFEGRLAEISKFLSTIDITVPKFDFDTDKILSTFDYFSKTGQSFVDNTISATTSVFSGIFNFFLAFTFSIYLLLDKEKVLRISSKAVCAFLPKNVASYITNIAKRTDVAFSRFVTGQLTEAVILGVLCYIGMTIFNFPEEGLISIIVAVTALVPVFGAWIGAVLGAFIILLTQPISAIWFLIFLILLQQFETNIIYPRVVGKSVGLPGVLVLASVTLGGNMFGVIGMLVAVPVVSVIYSIFKETVDLFYNKRNGAS